MSLLCQAPGAGRYLPACPSTGMPAAACRSAGCRLLPLYRLPSAAALPSAFRCWSAVEPRFKSRRFQVHASEHNSSDEQLIDQLVESNVDAKTVAMFAKVLLEKDKAMSDALLEKEKAISAQKEMNALLEKEKAISAQKEKNALLEKEKDKAALMYMTANYLRVEGLLSMRGVLEYIQQSVKLYADVEWTPQDPVMFWKKYIKSRRSLQKLLRQSGLEPQAVAGQVATIYSKLSSNIHDAKTPQEYQASGDKVSIGHPLDQDQRKIMACLCEDVNIPYQTRPAHL